MSVFVDINGCSMCTGAGSLANNATSAVVRLWVLCPFTPERFQLLSSINCHNLSLRKSSTSAVEMNKILYLLCSRKAVISIYVTFSTHNSLTVAFPLQGQRTLRPQGVLASQYQPTICCNGDHGWEVSKTHIWSCWWACAQSPRNVGKWDS